MSGESVVAVLWDADGVLQEIPASWPDLFAEVLGVDPSQALLDVLLPEISGALDGGVSMIELLPRALEELGLGDRLDQVVEVWGTVDPVEPSRALLTELRARGIGCHLATNQDDLRATYMRSRLGYDDLVDRSFYSCEVGAAKPDAAYFLRVADELGLAPQQLAFVDDTLENVHGASALGLHVVHWHRRDGMDQLRAGLRSCGLEVA